MELNRPYGAGKAGESLGPPYPLLKKKKKKKRKEKKNARKSLLLKCPFFEEPFQCALCERSNKKCT